MSKIEKEIIIASAMEPQGGTEQRAGYLARLARAAGSLDEDAWKALDDTTQRWANGAILALNEKQAIPEVTDLDDGVKVPVPVPKKKRGAGRILREKFILNPELTVPELIAAVEAEGYAITKMSAEVARYETRATLKVIEKLGLKLTPAEAVA